MGKLAFYGNIHFSVPIVFTERLQFKNILGLWLLNILIWNNMLFEQLHLLVVRMVFELNK